MTLTLTLTPEKETRLQRKASIAGMPLDEYLFWIADREGSVDEDERGVARVTGSRIRIAQIASEATRLGMTPEEIGQAHPHLTMAQIHTALGFYHSRKDEIDAQIDASLAEADRAREAAGESPFAARMRAEGRLPAAGRAA